jgi:hypothetical protein
METSRESRKYLKDLLDNYVRSLNILLPTNILNARNNFESETSKLTEQHSHISSKLTKRKQLYLCIYSHMMLEI